MKDFSIEQSSPKYEVLSKSSRNLKVLNTLTKKDFQDAFQKWQKRWDRCVRSQGDYFEGDGAE
jgi:hypothetical protein